MVASFVAAWFKLTVKLNVDVVAPLPCFTSAIEACGVDGVPGVPVPPLDFLQLQILKHSNPGSI